MGFAEGDFAAFEAGAVLGGEGFQGAAGVEDADGQGFEFVFHGVGQSAVEDFLGGGEV
jgi:hypothetical protein